MRHCGSLRPFISTRLKLGTKFTPPSHPHDPRHERPSCQVATESSLWFEISTRKAAGRCCCRYVHRWCPRFWEWEAVLTRWVKRLYQASTSSLRGVDISGKRRRLCSPMNGAPTRYPSTLRHPREGYRGGPTHDGLGSRTRKRSRRTRLRGQTKSLRPRGGGNGRSTATATKQTPAKAGAVDDGKLDAVQQDGQEKGNQ
jgi:hypothetical protein